MMKLRVGLALAVSDLKYGQCSPVISRRCFLLMRRLLRYQRPEHVNMCCYVESDGQTFRNWHSSSRRYIAIPLDAQSSMKQRNHRAKSAT